VTRVPLLALALSACLAAGGCGGTGHGTIRARQAAATTASAAPNRLTDLRNIGQLRAAFNGAAGEPRLIILMSPT